MVEHDGEVFTPKDAYNHFSYNGHQPEGAMFCIPCDMRKIAGEISDKIRDIFEAKKPRHIRARK